MNTEVIVRALEAYRATLTQDVDAAIAELRSGVVPQAAKITRRVKKAAPAPKRERKPRAEGLAARVEATLDREGQPVSIIADALGATRPAVSSALQSLVKQGRAEKKGRGVFARAQSNGASEASAE